MRAKKNPGACDAGAKVDKRNDASVSYHNRQQQQPRVAVTITGESGAVIALALFPTSEAAKAYMLAGGVHG
jgi:hypothetical protein